LLAFLARGENARTAYLSLTRGDGGQNIIGSELFESLGIIRTEELLQARRLDGAEQFFTRAYDYGFSKTLDEAKQKWDEKIILCDAVRAIRTFRPLVVISRFSGTPADGHGQHQFAGYIAPLAVKAAADVNQCKDSGAAWQVLKFYVSQGFRSTEKPTLSINTGAYDFLLGRSYFEIAMEGRSQHKTQEQGVLELKGERLSGLNLIESKVPKVENEKSVFDGIDISITGLPKFNKQTKYFSNENLGIVQKSAERALSEYALNDSQKILPILAEGFTLLRKAHIKAEVKEVYSSTLDNNSLEKELAESKIAFGSLIQKEYEFIEAIKLASGIQIDTLTDKETITPDESFPVTTRVYFPQSSNVKVKEIKLQTPDGWQISKADAPKETNQGFFRREVANETAYFNVKVPANEKPTQPFWMENNRESGLFDVRENIIESFQLPILNCVVTAEIEGTEINFTQPVEYRFADDVRGEVRRNLNVVPKVSLTLNQDLLIVPQSEKSQTRQIVLSITNNSSAAISGEAKLNLPNSWKVTPNAASFSLKSKGEKTSVAFDLTIPAKFNVGDFELGARAVVNGEIFTKTMNTLAYPHIQTHRFYTDAKTKITVLDLKTASATIGYIMGSGDEVPEAIRQMGLAVESLSETDLTSGNLSRFSTIVVGVRAAQVRQDFVANHQRLIDYVKNGGNLIVQYQRPDYETLLPFPAKIGARVADENAKVTILDQGNPIFNFPNRITEKDFEGWVQERNLYSFTTFDANYKPLLEAHDANEPENKGGLVMGQIGKGKYVYCSYAFFRQLPAGVPGAYRIFANLLSLKQ
jgi:LmbE family N-acetylglucosaminyl deacetylase